MSSVLGSVAINTALSLGGAAMGASYAEWRKPWVSSAYGFDASPIIDAGIGAVALPTAFHLAKPLVLGAARGGGAAALSAVPASLAGGALFGSAAVVGAIVGGSLTDDSDGQPHGGYDFSGLSALPGLALGAMAGPPIWSLARASLSTGYGLAAFVALAAGILGTQRLVQRARK